MRKYFIISLIAILASSVFAEKLVWDFGPEDFLIIRNNEKNLKVDNHMKLDGKSSLAIFADKPIVNNRPAFDMKDRCVHIKPFTKYVLEFYTKHENMNSRGTGIRFKLNVWDVRPMDIYEDSFTFPKKGSSDIWEKHRFEFITVREADRVVLWFELYPNVTGRAWVNGIKLYQVSEDMAFYPKQTQLKIKNVIDLPGDSQYVKFEMKMDWRKFFTSADLYVNFFSDKKCSRKVGTEKAVISGYKGLQPQWSGLAIDWFALNRPMPNLSHSRHAYENSDNVRGSAKTIQLLKVPLGARYIKIRNQAVIKDKSAGTLNLSDVKLTAEAEFTGIRLADPN